MPKPKKKKLTFHNLHDFFHKEFNGLTRDFKIGMKEAVRENDLRRAIDNKVAMETVEFLADFFIDRARDTFGEDQ